MAFQLATVSCPLRVQGRVPSDDVGEFSGMVLAVAMQDTDPVASTAMQREDAGRAEGIAGWGSTFFLVADPSKPAPVWVAKHDVRSQQLE